MADIPSISLPATTILEFEQFHVNNSVLSLLLVTLIITFGAAIFKSSMKLVPGRYQLAIEEMVGFFLEQLKNAWGGSEKESRRALPFIITIFFIILIGNQFSLIPLVSSVVTEGVQVLRTPTSDLSLTITMGLMMVVGSHVIAIIKHPFRHIGNFIKIKPFFHIRKLADIPNAFLELFLGFLDIVGEFAKIMSMSFRLFGNIFAGEVMIAIITGLLAYLVPMPFILISTFSGIIQAFVFSILSLNFMAGIFQSSASAPQEA